MPPSTTRPMKSHQSQSASESGRRQMRAGGTGALQTQPIPVANARRLPAHVAEEMQGKFGEDFSGVRLHDGAEAQAKAEALQARAYTVGEHVVLGRNAPPLASQAGQYTMAHELAHVVQQRRGGPPPVQSPQAAHEVGADRAAAAAVSGAGAIAVAGATGVGVARQPIDPRHARGYAGEQGMGFELYPSSDGWVFVEGPSGAAGHNATAPGFDGVAYNTKTGELHIVDNKSFKRTGNVHSATAITKNLGKNLNDLIAKVEAMPKKSFPHKAKVLSLLKQTRDALAAGKTLPAKSKLIVTGSGGRSTGVSQRLKNLGVEFRDTASPQSKAPAGKDAKTAASPPAPKTSSKAGSSKTSPSKASSSKASTPKSASKSAAKPKQAAAKSTAAKRTTGKKAATASAAPKATSPKAAAPKAKPAAKSANTKGATPKTAASKPAASKASAGSKSGGAKTAAKKGAAPSSKGVGPKGVPTSKAATPKTGASKGASPKPKAPPPKSTTPKAKGSATKPSASKAPPPKITAPDAGPAKPAISKGATPKAPPKATTPEPMVPKPSAPKSAAAKPGMPKPNVAKPGVPAPKGGGPSVAGGAFSIALPMVMGWLHGKAVEKRIDKQSDEKGFVPHNAPSGEGLAYDLGAWLLDPMRDAEKNVDNEKRFKIAPWRQKVRNVANSTAPGGTFDFTWEDPYCGQDLFGNPEAKYDYRKVTYKKGAGGRLSVESGDASGVLDLNDVISEEISDAEIDSRIPRISCGGGGEA
jgi:hypothetical protein